MWIPKSVNKNMHDSTIQSPRYGHSAAVTGFDMFVIGGYNGNNTCNRQLWKYILMNNSWSALPINDQFLSSIAMEYCEFGMIAENAMLWIATSYYSDTRGYHELWLYVIHSQTLAFMIETRRENTLAGSASYAFWQEYLLNTNNKYALWYIKIGCPLRLSSSDVSLVPCHICKVGFYAAVGSTECRKCPNGMTTRDERSSTMTNSIVCVTGYCGHGTCLVVSNTLKQIPVCTCHIGFTGSRCQDSTYYYIGKGVVVVAVIIILLLILLIKTLY